MPDESIYGIHPVTEALKSSRPVIQKIFVAAGKHGGALRYLVQLAREKNIPVHDRPQEFLTGLAQSQHHQGVVALTAGIPYTSWEDFLESIRGKKNGRAQVLLLDSIEDPQNLGSLIRTAEACGVRGIVIPKDRAVGLTPAVIKSSAGAAAYIPVVRVTNLSSTLDELKREGFWIVGTHQGGEKSLYEMKFDMDVGLVIGSEGKGIRPLVLRHCDHTIRIPMRGKIESLNAAIAGAIVLYEILRQNLEPGSARL
jgi:23S rRNA (guanosine2251-2'-O)-methyltransferase